MGMAVVDFHLPGNGSRLTLSGRNIGVLQTTVAEIATEKAHQRKSTCRSVDLGLSSGSFCICHHAICLVVWVCRSP